MTDPSAPAVRDAHVRSESRATEGFDDSVQSRWWDVAFVGVPLLAAGVVLVGGTGPGDMLSVGALLGVIALWGLFRIVRLRRAPAAAVVQVAIPVAGLLAIAGSPNAGTIQALIFPFVWTLTRTYRQALAVNVAFGIASFFAFAVGLGVATEQGVTGPVLISAAGIAGFSLIFSIAFGTWITRISLWGEERARLLAELTAAQVDLAAAHREAGERAERERLSRELHDTLTQSLTGLVMLSQRASHLAEGADPDVAALRPQLELIGDVAREALGEARAVVASTASVKLDGGLAAALRSLAGRVTRETGIRVDIDVDAAPSRELEVVLLRCAQEALANVRKHSGAVSASVRVRHRDGLLRLTVVDDGAGIDSVEQATDRGFGLTGMRDRLALVGGTLRLSSPATGGTTLEIDIPEGEAA